MSRLLRTLLSSVLLLAAIDPATQSAAVESIEFADGVIRACVGPQGRLRLAPPDGACSPSETPTAWQQRGGVRVYDAAGRELGRFLPDDSGAGQAVLHEQTGVRLDVSPLRGTISNNPTVSFTEPDCKGEAFVPTGTRRSVGTLIGTLLGERGQLFVVTAERRSEIPIRSQLEQLSFSVRCSATAPGSVLSDGLRILPFAGELGFEFPVPVPLTYQVSPEVGAQDLVRACIRANGGPRIPAAGSECRPGEAPDLWQRTGGLHAFDREGRDVGLLMVGRSDGFLWLFLPEKGVWLEVSTQTGAFARRSLIFTDPECRGDAYTPFRDLVGLVFPRQLSRPPQFLVVTRREVLVGGHWELTVEGSCVARGGAGQPRLVLAVEPYTEDLGISPIGLAGPLAIGYPGSPFANPGGEGADAGVLHACAGPSGRLRVVDSPADCLGQESHVAWSRRGGVRLLDGSDRDLGTLAHLGVSSVSVLDDASGLRFPIDFASGELADETPFTRVSFMERDCQGIAVRFISTGIVFPNVFSPTGMFVETRQRVTSVPQSYAITQGPCVNETGIGSSFWILLEPFSQLPWTLPIELPLRLTTEID